MINLNSKAHSFDSLEILHENDSIYVRKIFRNDINRAEKNVLKQKLFKTVDTGSLKILAAEVIDFSISQDEAVLLMPYIDGLNADSFPIYASSSTASALSTALSALIYLELGNSVEKNISTALFNNKIIEVIKNTKDYELKKLIISVSDFIATLPTELPFPIGVCHGDLTLSNMILNSSKGLVLIDFLDTYLESPLQDVVKLCQDFVYRWSFRNSTEANQVKADILCRHYKPSVIDHMTRLYPTQIKLLMVMTLARIAPYTKDVTTKQWLLNSLLHCLRN